MRDIAWCWHQEALADPVVSHAFSHGVADDHVERLAHYLAEALGGGDHYRRTYGEPAQVDRLHAGNGEHPEMDSAAIAAFDRAVRRAGIPQPAAGEIRRYWAWATRSPMAAHPESPDTVPADQGVHTWTWGGIPTARRAEGCGRRSSPSRRRPSCIWPSACWARPCSRDRPRSCSCRCSRWS